MLIWSMERTANIHGVFLFQLCAASGRMWRTIDTSWGFTLREDNSTCVYRNSTQLSDSEDEIFDKRDPLLVIFRSTKIRSFDWRFACYCLSAIKSSKFGNFEFNSRCHDGFNPFDLKLLNRYKKIFIFYMEMLHGTQNLHSLIIIWFISKTWNYIELYN